MRVLIVSGIWPPDVGGPASHGPELGAFLAGRSHEVHAVTSAGRADVLDPGFPITVARRDLPRLIRQPVGAATIANAVRRVKPHVIYATGMYGRSTLASSLGRVPLVIKLASDPAYERARRIGLFSGTLEEFQRPQHHRALRLMKSVRLVAISRASRVIIPSRYLAEIAADWGLERISVIPNPAPAIDSSTPREELRNRLGLSFPTFVFAGRLVEQKNLTSAVAALREVSEATLIVIGDGPERGQLDQTIAAYGLGDRIICRGALPRSQAVEWMRAADAAILPSAWENFPHAAVEALAAGTPVIATAVGGVPEIVRSGVNGILVPPGDTRALAAALKTVVEEPEVLARLREGAAVEGSKYAADTIFAAIEVELERAAGLGRARAKSASVV